MGLEATILDHRERPFPSLQKVLKHLKHWLLHCLTLDELLLSLTHGALPVCDGEGRVPGQALSVSFIIYTLSSNVRAFLSLSGSLTFFSGFPTFWEDVSTKQQGGDGNNYAPHKFKWHEHEARSYPIRRTAESQLQLAPHALTQTPAAEHPQIHYNRFPTSKICFREKETSVCCSIYWFIHWLILLCALTRNWTSNLGVSGQCSNQLSYWARALLVTYLQLIRTNIKRVRVQIARNACIKMFFSLSYKWIF